MKIGLDRSTGVAIYQQIVEQVRGQILTGQMQPGYRLPPERQLAESLGVNRTTVLNAYRELKAEGLIGSHVGRGTVVLEGQAGEEPAPVASGEPVWDHLFSEYSNRFDSYMVGDILRLVNQRDIISFAAGIAALDSRPVEAFKGIERELLESEDRRALLVSPVEGFSSLRRAVAGYMGRRGCFCQPEEVMMLSGSQQGIDLCARVLIDPGDIVVMEEPTFFPAIQAFRNVGARIMGVPMTAEGMDLEVLAQLLQRYRPKLIYTMPTYHNPCGVTMPMQNRIRLLELAYRYRVLVVEDDAYGELCYDGQPLSSLKSMDSGGHVIYLNTFSKTVYPGLRLGWTVAGKQLIHRFAAAKQLIDLHANCLSQLIIERFIESGGIDRYLATICEENRERRDIMLTALDQYAPQGLTWNRPAGGYYIWCGLPPGITCERLIPKAAENGVAVLPGSAFHLSPRHGGEYIRLNYTYAAKKDIAWGIKSLCDAIRELVRIGSGRAKESEMEISPMV